METLASRAMDVGFEDGGVRSPLTGLFPKTLPVPTIAAALAPFGDKYPDLASGAASTPRTV